MHFSTSGLLTISIRVSHTCTMSSQLVFENTARQPVHKGDEDDSNYLISPQTICLFCDLSSRCFRDGSVGKKWKQFNGSLYKPSLPRALGQELQTDEDGRLQDGSAARKTEPLALTSSHIPYIWNPKPKPFNYRLCDLGKLFHLKDSHYSYL